MKIDKFNRRMFLQGAGKLTLAIPFLSSIAGSAFAMNDIPPRFIFMSAQNGGQQPNQWFPSIAPSTPHDLHAAYSNVPAHQYHTGAINFSSSNGIAPIFDQKFNSLVSKMNFLRGLDQRFAPFGNHHGSALLGNVSSAHSSVGFCPSIITIDQVMAYNKGFYPGEGVGYVRSLSINPKSSQRLTSANFENPYTKVGGIRSVPSMANPKLIFNKFFENTSALATQSSTPLIDGVLEDYKRVRNNRRLASEEKLFLDSVIDRLAQLELKLTTDVVPDIPACRGLTPPSSISSSSNPATEVQQLDLIVDTLILAFQCGRTRIATMHFHHANGTGDGSSHSAPSWHWSSHNASSGNQVALAKLEEIYKWIADHALYPLANKMDGIVEANGKTMLDNSLIHFATSSMEAAHNPNDLPTLLLGSAGGFFKTGNYIDYRNRSLPGKEGILHNQYLANVMYSMGLKKSDWNMKKLGFSVQGFSADEEGYGWYKHIPGARSTNKYTKSESTVVDPLPSLIEASALSKFV